MPLVLSCFENVIKPLLHDSNMLHDVLKEKAKNSWKRTSVYEFCHSGKAWAGYTQNRSKQGSLVHSVDLHK